MRTFRRRDDLYDSRGDTDWTPRVAPGLMISKRASPSRMDEAVEIQE